ncbi:hypothetical protein ALC53_09496 [Atta colombica]|uniref:Uncharacterized protein n=1 Tax=Atta colombica TaxID=520822 RepID=A0A195B6T1_9HYME|nr:hypothetical protein ALC53_09496 [Atta colombica]
MIQSRQAIAGEISRGALLRYQNRCIEKEGKPDAQERHMVAAACNGHENATKIDFISSHNEPESRGNKCMQQQPLPPMFSEMSLDSGEKLQCAIPFQSLEPSATWQAVANDLTTPWHAMGVDYGCTITTYNQRRKANDACTSQYRTQSCAEECRNSSGRDEYREHVLIYGFSAVAVIYFGIQMSIRDSVEAGTTLSAKKSERLANRPAIYLDRSHAQSSMNTPKRTKGEEKERREQRDADEVRTSKHVFRCHRHPSENPAECIWRRCRDSLRFWFLVLDSGPLPPPPSPLDGAPIKMETNEVGRNEVLR